MQNTFAIENNSSVEQGGRPLTGGTTRAALVSGSVQFITRILTVVLSIATARALEPREVGTLGLAVIVMGVISMIAYYPETAAVAMRCEERDEKLAAASVVLKSIVVTLLIALMLLTFPVLAEYLTGKEGGGRELRQLLLVLSWTPLLELLGCYPRVVLQRRLYLNWISAAGLLQPIIFVGLAVVLLWSGYGYLGVAWASVVGTGAATVFVWLCLGWKSEVGWDGWPSKEALRETFAGSARVFTGGFGGFLGERLDNLLVSGAIGPTAMSFYSMAWNGSRTPANLFGSTIGFVLIPTLARIQDEPTRVKRAVHESLRYSYLLLAPMCALMLVSAPLVVSYILGDKWLPLVPCFRVMCITVLVIPILHACNALLVSSGRAHLTGIATAVHLVALTAFIPLGCRLWGTLGAAYGDLAAMALLTITLYITARVSIHQVKWTLAPALSVPVIAATLAGSLSWSFGAYFDHGFLRLLIDIGIMFLGYPLFVAIFGGRARLLDLATLLRGALRRTAITA